jgi:hypothetical protein
MEVKFPSVAWIDLLLPFSLRDVESAATAGLVVVAQAAGVKTHGEYDAPVNCDSRQIGSRASQWLDAGVLARSCDFGSPTSYCRTRFELGGRFNPVVVAEGRGNTQAGR